MANCVPFCVVHWSAGAKFVRHLGKRRKIIPPDISGRRMRGKGLRHAASAQSRLHGVAQFYTHHGNVNGIILPER
jgi:hypothetical protein